MRDSRNLGSTLYPIPVLWMTLDQDFDQQLNRNCTENGQLQCSRGLSRGSVHLDWPMMAIKQACILVSKNVMLGCVIPRPGCRWLDIALLDMSNFPGFAMYLIYPPIHRSLAEEIDRHEARKDGAECAYEYDARACTYLD